VTKFQRIRWTGYVAFMEQRRHDGKRGLARPRRIYSLLLYDSDYISIYPPTDANNKIHFITITKTLTRFGTEVPY
jgi:hypothetical protein